MSSQNVSSVTSLSSPRGFAKLKQIVKIRDNFGSGWVGPGLTRNCFFFLENRPKIALNQWKYLLSSIPCVSCLYICIAKVVGYYDLSCSVHVSDGFPEKSLDGGWVGGVSSINKIGIFGFFSTLQSPLD